MNTKMRDFVLRHDAMSKAIDTAAKSAKTKATTEEIKSDVLSEKAKKTKKIEINKAAKSAKTRKKRSRLCSYIGKMISTIFIIIIRKARRSIMPALTISSP